VIRTPLRPSLLLSLLAAVSLAAPSRAASAPSEPLTPVNAWLRANSVTTPAWDINGAFRFRYEDKEHAGSFPNRDFAGDQVSSNDFLLLRTIVNVGWKPAPGFSAQVSGRDSHVSSDLRPTTETDAFDLQQAWVQWGRPQHWLVKIGRQELLYGDQRYVGNADWSNTGRVFDAVRGRLEQGTSWVEAFTSRVVIPQHRHFNQSNRYDAFSGVYGSTRRLLPIQDTEVYFLARNVTASSPTAITPTLGGPGARDIYTLGTRWKSVAAKTGPWDYTVEFTAQRGRIGQAGKRLDHRAYAFNVVGGHTWKDVGGSPRLGLGYDYGSGDSNPNDACNETFELLFGTNHRLYGNMDLVGLRNLHAARLEGSMRPNARLSLALEYMQFWMADTADLFYPESGAGRSANGYRRSSELPRSVGQELDLLVDWRITPTIQIRTGLAHFFAGQYIRRSIARVPANGAAVDARWFYFQATANF
jgi:hypothetical protein